MQVIFVFQTERYHASDLSFAKIQRTGRSYVHFNKDRTFSDTAFEFNEQLC
jgi:hypothetical protein